MNLSSVVFMSSMIIGTTLAISSSEWILMWVGLEVNLMSFIPIMKTNNSPYESEASMKYFLIQAMASAIMMAAILMSENQMLKEMSNTILMMALFMKMGATPFHTWYPGVMQGLSWMNCLILMTWQKVAPMIMIGYKLTPNLTTNMIVMSSALVGAIGTLGQTSLRKLIAYSSISHVGWMIMAMSMMNSYWCMYFLLYTMMNIATVIIFWSKSIFHMSQIFNKKTNGMIKMVMFTSMLSLGGMPPFMGFIPKWILIQNMIESQNFMIIMVMVMSTLITLYAYMRMTYSAFTMNNQTTLWQSETPNMSIMYTSMAITIMGMPLISWISLT